MQTSNPARRLFKTKNMIRYNKKLWSKFVSKRLYAFDLVHMVDGSEQKILRFIRGVSCNKYKSDGGESIDIPDVFSTANYQIYENLSKLDWVNAFIKSRKICQKYPDKFKIRASFVIKELR